MQLMPVTGVTMLANYPQESHCAKARRPPPRSPVRPSAVSSRRARAQRVHPWRLPWRPHAYRAALRVSPASKFSERYPSFPPNFTTFGHFLQPTTTWIVLTKPSSALLCKKILAPSKVGLNRKRSDFLDLPNGLLARLRKTTRPTSCKEASSAGFVQLCCHDDKQSTPSAWHTFRSWRIVWRG